MAGILETSVARCPFFDVTKISLEAPRDVRAEGRFALVSMTNGTVRCAGMSFGKGRFFIVPASGIGLELTPLNGPAEILLTTLPV